MSQRSQSADDVTSKTRKRDSKKDLSRSRVSKRLANRAQNEVVEVPKTETVPDLPRKRGRPRKNASSQEPAVTKRVKQTVPAQVVSDQIEELKMDSLVIPTKNETTESQSFLNYGKPPVFADNMVMRDSESQLDEDAELQCMVQNTKKKLTYEEEFETTSRKHYQNGSALSGRNLESRNAESEINEDHQDFDIGLSESEEDRTITEEAVSDYEKSKSSSKIAISKAKDSKERLQQLSLTSSVSRHF